MKIAIWPVLILPLSYVFTTPLRWRTVTMQLLTQPFSCHLRDDPHAVIWAVLMLPLSYVLTTPLK